MSGMLDRVEVYKDEVGDWRYRGRARNHEVVATGEGYQRRDDALHTVAELFPGIPVVELDRDESPEAK